MIIEISIYIDIYRYPKISKIIDMVFKQTINIDIYRDIFTILSLRKKTIFFFIKCIFICILHNYFENKE